MHGIIIGGGIGGMALAAALERVGIWSRGRGTLLGDAAHPTTPNLGQGACQAIEDAVVLADQLRGGGDPATAFRTYEKLRQRRTARITEESFRCISKPTLTHEGGP